MKGRLSFLPREVSQTSGRESNPKDGVKLAVRSQQTS